MSSPRVQGFVFDTQTLITETLRIADAWSALQQEFAAMQTNGTTPTQAAVDAVFGTGNVTIQQYLDALVAQQAVVDALHAEPTRSKLYRVRR